MQKSKRTILMIFILVLTSFQSMVCQTNPPTTTRATASQTVSLTSGSASTLESELQALTDEAEKALADNPDDLAQVLQSLATTLVNAITNSVVTVLNDDDFSPSEVAKNISVSVEKAFASISNSNTAFADLDIETISTEIQTSVEQILNEPGATEQITETTKKVAEAVLGAIGTAFASISGNQFQFSSVVEVTTSSSTSTQQNSVSASASATETSTPSADDLLSILQGGDIQGTANLIIQLVEQRPALVTFFLSALSQQQLQSTLVNVFTQLFANPNLPERGFVDALAQAYAQDGGENITMSLGQAISAANAAGEFDGLVEILIYGFTQVGPALDVLTDSIKYAINQDGCAAVNLVLTGTKSSADKKGVGIVVSNVLDKIPEIRECLLQSAQIEISTSIVQSFTNVNSAYSLIQSSTQQGQTSAVADAFIQALNSGQEENLKVILDLFLSSEDITPQAMGVVITLTIRQGGRDAVELFLDTIKDIKDTSQLVIAFSYALTSKEVELVDAISSLIKSSIEGEVCGLSGIIDGVFAEVSSSESEQIAALLQSIDAQQCLPESLQVLVPPLEETNQVVPPVVIAPPPSQDFVINMAFPGTQPNPSPTPAPVSTPAPPVVIPSIPSPQPILPTPTAPAPTTARQTGCLDVVPPGDYTCAQQKKFGKCERKWMRDGGFCAKTCEFCTDTCFDIAPDSKYSCFDQKTFGKCSASWIIEGGYCRFTCGLCEENSKKPTFSSGIIQNSPTPVIVQGQQQQQQQQSNNCPQVQDTCVQCCECPAQQQNDDERTKQLIRDTVAEVLKATEK